MGLSTGDDEYGVSERLESRAWEKGAVWAVVCAEETVLKGRSRPMGKNTRPRIAEGQNRPPELWIDPQFRRLVFCFKLADFLFRC